jgi:ribosomal protein S18 acetylase RimI-like enzyme
MESFALEPGRPVDAPIAARLVAETDRDLFTFLTGGSLSAWIEISEHEWRHERGIYSYTMADMVRVGATIHGLVVSYLSGRHLEIDWDLGSSAPYVSADLMARIRAVRDVVFSLFPAIPDGVWYVQNIAVAPEAQGKGLGRFLMKAIEARAAEAGCAALHLDVDSSSPAVRFYLRLGFEVLVETRVPSIPGVQAHYRMVRKINSSM